MIFKHFDGFSWFLGNVKISWFSNTLTVFHDCWAIWKSDDFLNFLTVFQDFWAMWKSHDFQTLWRFFMISGQCENLMIFKLFDGFSWFLGNVKISLLLWFLNTLTVFHDFWAMWKSHDFQTLWRFFMISGQCKNLIAFMIFKHFDGFSWFLGNVKISWFSNTLTVFHDFWAIWKSHDFQTLWRFFMISGQCENLMIFFILFDGFSWFLGNVKIWWFFILFDGFSWFLVNVKISWFSNFLTVFHDFWAMWKSHCFYDF
jgi:hypothetical protein